MTESAGLFPGQVVSTSASDQKSMDQDELKKIFNQYDTDGSGEIDLKELCDAVRTLGIKCTANGVRKVLSYIDQDGNHMVDWKEFYDFFSKVRNPEEIKNLLASTNQRFLDYKTMVEGDPNFQKRFYIPTMAGSTRKYEGHNDNVEDVQWLSDTQFISCSLDSEMRVWDISDPRAVRTIAGADAGIYALSVIEDPNNPKALTGLGSKTGGLWFWDLSNDSVVQKYEGHDAPVYSATIASDKRFALSGAKNGKVCLHDLTKNVPMCIMEKHEGVVYSCDFADDCTTICTASGDGTILVSDIKAISMAKPVITIEDAAATGICYKALWRGEYEILSGGDDYCIKRWDIRNVSDGPITNYFGHTSVVRTICLSECKKFMVSATNDGCLRFWVVDEQSNIVEEQDKCDTKIEIAEAKRKKIDEDLESGEGNISPRVLKDMVGQLKSLYDKADELAKVKEERESMACIQAHIACDGHTVPVVGIAMRDDAKNGRTINIVSAAQDQSLRLFNCEKPDTSVFRRWMTSEQAT
eukprot:GEMP01007046.1.p1 GENE.GEMP01007046.1~~GEMP01007046.1.p1  ORF type:complete len:525 (+),score=108.91 GEMP01007046.1:134-1708(+)